MSGAAEKARALLDNNQGSSTERAQAWATLAVAEAVDRLTAGVAGQDRACGDCGSDFIQFVPRKA